MMKRVSGKGAQERYTKRGDKHDMDKSPRDIFGMFFTTKK